MIKYFLERWQIQTIMIGPFSKDIWGIIYEKLEIDFDPLTLNNLSRTCKKLYNVDNIRKKNYELKLKKINKTYQNTGRQDYITLLENSYITQYLNEYWVESKRNSKEISQWLKKLNVRNLGISEKSSEQEITTKLIIVADEYNSRDCFLIPISDDLDLISTQTGALLYDCLFMYFFHDRDIISAIMEIQESVD
jgi:hypothetical protein